MSTQLLDAHVFQLHVAVGLQKLVHGSLSSHLRRGFSTSAHSIVHGDQALFFPHKASKYIYQKTYLTTLNFICIFNVGNLSDFFVRPELHITHVWRPLQVQEQIIQFVPEWVIDHLFFKRAYGVLLVVHRLWFHIPWMLSVVLYLTRETPLSLSCKKPTVLFFAYVGVH